MREIGIRALKQNASAVVAAAAAGETMVVTDRGRPVAQLGPLPASPLQAMIERGEARPPLRPFNELPAPIELPAGSPSLSEVLRQMRDDERY